MLLRYQGILMSGSYNHELIVTSFDPPTTALQGNSAARYGHDGTSSPREWLGESTWVWTVVTNVHMLSEAMALASRLEAAWKDPGVRNSTAHVPLEYSNDGGASWFRVYGRPGRFTSFTPNVSATQGVGSMDLEFVQRDPLHYASAERGVSISLAPVASASGWTAPFTFPLTSEQTGQSLAGAVTNGGDRETPLAVTFHGPARDPILRRNGMYFGYRGSLAYDQWVRIDAFNQSVTLGSRGATPVPVPGGVTPRYSLSEFTARAGRTDWTFEALDPTGTARAVLTWRDAYASMQHGGDS